MTPILDFKRFLKLSITSLLTGMGFGAIVIFWRITITNLSIGTILTASLITAFITLATIALIRSYKKSNK